MSDGTRLRLKMAVTHVVPYIHASSGETESEAISLVAVSGGAGSANAEWSKWTPSGTLSFVVTNPSAFGKVNEGEYYFLDLVETSEDEAEEVVLEDEDEPDAAEEH